MIWDQAVKPYPQKGLEPVIFHSHLNDSATPCTARATKGSVFNLITLDVYPTMPTPWINHNAQSSPSLKHSSPAIQIFTLETHTLTDSLVPLMTGARFPLMFDTHQLSSAIYVFIKLQQNKKCQTGRWDPEGKRSNKFFWGGGGKQGKPW